MKIKVWYRFDKKVDLLIIIEMNLTRSILVSLKELFTFLQLILQVLVLLNSAELKSFLCKVICFAGEAVLAFAGLA